MKFYRYWIKYTRDILLPEISRYKVLIFVNLLAPSPEIRCAIDALKGDGRTLIWSYSSGLYGSDNVPNVRNMTGLTGMDGFQFVESVDFPATGVNEVCSQKPGILPLEAERDFPDWRSVYTWNPDLSIEMLRREYARAKVWSFLDSPDVLQVSDGALMVHATTAGRKTVRLPLRKFVTDITENEELGEIKSWSMELNAHETRIFLLD